MWPTSMGMVDGVRVYGFATEISLHGAVQLNSSLPEPPLHVADGTTGCGGMVSAQVDAVRARPSAVERERGARRQSTPPRSVLVSGTSLLSSRAGNFHSWARSESSCP